MRILDADMLVIDAEARRIGKSAGDSVEVVTPGGGKSYEILKVRFK